MGAPTDPLPLNDGRYLRLTVGVWLADTPDGRRLKVRKTGYQYQCDEVGKDWICRYDYLREPGLDPHPQSHVQIRGTLASPSITHDLRRIHFPTGRIAIEAVARLLADQFQVPCNRPAATWRAVLAQSEKTFQEIAHRPLSGPPT